MRQASGKMRQYLSYLAHYEQDINTGLPNRFQSVKHLFQYVLALSRTHVNKDLISAFYVGICEMIFKK